MGLMDDLPVGFGNDQLTTATLATSERWRAAKLAEAYYLSHQYDLLKSWDAPGPLHKKRPREIIPLYKTAVDTIVRFAWGGARFPRVIIGSTAKEGVIEGEVGPLVKDNDARELTTFVVHLVKQARLDRCALEYTRRAAITGSAAVIIGTRGGHLSYYIEPGYHCTPTFKASNPRELDRLDILYQFEREEATSGSTVQKKKYWFRRVIDDVADIVYKPVEVRPGVDPTWSVDKSQSVTHGLGFCPVRWVRTAPLSPTAIDGQPLIDPALYPLLDRINYIYSQRSRAVEYMLDPQWVRKNVDPSAREELQKNPGKIWDIADSGPDRKAEIEMIEAKGTGSDTAQEHIKDLQDRFYEAVGVVLSAMDKMSTRGNVSGVVLEYLHAPMIAVASELRKDLGDDSFCDIVSTAMRVVMTEVKSGRDIWIQGSRKAAKQIEKAQIDGPWLDMPVRLQWGRFFSPTAQDVGTAVQAAALAKNVLVAETSATRFVADYFGVTDIDSEVDQLDDPTALDPGGGGKPTVNSRGGAGPTAIPRAKVTPRPSGGQ
jgi:hypothetical protein